MTCCLLKFLHRNMQFSDEILEWLQCQFGQDRNYQLEMCDHTISILQSLMSQNKKRDREALIRVKDLKQKTKDYRMESRAMKVSLNFIGLTFDQLSESCWKYLGTLSKTAELLKLSRLSDTDYIIGLTDLRYRMEEVERHNCKLKRKSSRIGQGSKTLENLERLWQNLDLDPVFTRINQGRELKFRSQELKIYKGLTAKKKKYLKDVDANSSVLHKKIVAQKQELEWIQKKYLALHSKVDMYRHLPPSLSKIEAAVQQMEEERMEMEHRLSGCIDSSVL